MALFDKARRFDRLVVFAVLVCAILIIVLRIKQAFKRPPILLRHTDLAFQTGDVLLASSSFLPLVVGRMILGSNVTHVGIVYVDSGSGQVWVVESRSSLHGITMTPIQEFMQTEQRRVYFRPLINPRKRLDVGAFEAYLVEALDFEYSYRFWMEATRRLMPLRLPLPHELEGGDKSSKFCSEIVYELLVKLGALQAGPLQNGARAMPSDFYAADELNILPWRPGWGLGPVCEVEWNGDCSSSSAGAAATNNPVPNSLFEKLRQRKLLWKSRIADKISGLVTKGGG